MGEAKVLTKLKNYARKLKRDLFALYLSYQDKRVSWFAKLVAICVVAYAFSPIDLIPDFIPVLGYLDDLIIVPLGIAFALRLIPAPIIEEHRAKADELRQKGKPKNWFVGILFIIIWILLAYWLGKIFYGLMYS